MNRKDLLLKVIEYTNQAMLYELNTNVGFGKVTFNSVGSHTDMNAYTFIDSVSVINKYMFQFAELGYSNFSIKEIYDKAIEIGKNCEYEMYQKTKGINTHKGLIFVLGTLVIASMKALYEKKAFRTIFTNCKLLTQAKLEELQMLNTDSNLSHGEKIYIKYKIEGVRKEAALGFPIIQKAMEVFDVDNKESLVRTLIYIMSLCDDTTIVHRLGVEELEKVKLTMKRLFEKGYDNEELKEIEKEMIKKGISPGGSADLLCGTIFLSLIKNEFREGEYN